MATNPRTVEHTIRRAVEVVAENAGRRFAAGQTYAQAVNGALDEFAARWPDLADVVANIINPQEVN